MLYLGGDEWHEFSFHVGDVLEEDMGDIIVRIMNVIKHDEYNTMNDNNEGGFVTRIHFI